MALVAAILLAIFVLEDGWRIAAVAAGGAIEIAESWTWWRWSHRRKPTVGVEALVGKIGEATGDGWVKVNGELWRTEGTPRGRVRVTAVEGLTLVVEPV